MDIEAFLNRTNRTKADLLRELGRDPKSSLIASYIAGRAYPPYDVCVKLLRLGITPKELFGEEIDELIRAYYLKSSDPQVPSKFESNGFKEGALLASQPMTKDEIVAMLLEMKAKGEI